MKKYLIKIALFFALVTILDVGCGYTFRFMISKAKYGETYKKYYIANIGSDDVIILGSSYAARHYVPSVIQDSLGLSCYNCGEPGCGIIPAYARYKMISERKKPRLVIYEVTPVYDYYVSDDYSKYLGCLRQYTDKKSVLEMYETFGDELEFLRLMSNMYCNNSCIIHNLMDMIVPTKDNRGYEPLYGILTEEAIAKKKETLVDQDIKGHEVDSLKLSYVEQLFADISSDGVKMICMVSPDFNPFSEAVDEIYAPVMVLCNKYRVPFIYNKDFESITGNRELFQDFCHLNDKGAKMYTAAIMPIFRQYLKE